jgi:RecA-family ATPase
VTPQRLTLASVLSPPVEQFLLGGLLPLAKVSVLYGPTGSGKSAWLAQIAFSIAAGARSLHGLTVQAHGAILVVSAEDSLDDWMRKAGALRRGTDINVEAALESVHIVDLADGEARLSEVVTVRDATTVRREARPTTLADRIIEMARDVGAVLIVVETASRFAEDESNESLSALQSALGRIARSTGAAVVVTHHSTKAASRSNDSSIESARGGGSFVSNARNAISLYPAEPDVARLHRERFAAEDLFVLAHGKSTSSTRREPPITLVRLSTPHGAVFARPGDVEANPEQVAEAKARAGRGRAKEVEGLQRLYALVESILPSKPSISPSHLLHNRCQDLGVTKRKMTQLIELALAQGVLREGARSARGITLILGQDPRKAA